MSICVDNASVPITDIGTCRCNVGFFEKIRAGSTFNICMRCPQNCNLICGLPGQTFSEADFTEPEKCPLQPVSLTSTDTLPMADKFIIRSTCYGYAENRLRIHIPYNNNIHLYDQALNLSEPPKRVKKFNHSFGNSFKDSTCVATYSGHYLLGGRYIKPYIVEETILVQNLVYPQSRRFISLYDHGFSGFSGFGKAGPNYWPVDYWGQEETLIAYLKQPDIVVTGSKVVKQLSYINLHDKNTKYRTNYVDLNPVTYSLIDEFPEFFLAV